MLLQSLNWIGCLLFIFKITLFKCWKVTGDDFLTCPHRHLREIDCSLAVVGGPAAGAECGGKSIHLPCIQRQIDFIAAAAAGNITTTVNKGRWPGQ